jgi:hypothetical protein
MKLLLITALIALTGCSTHNGLTAGSATRTVSTSVGSPVTTPFVQHIETIATDGRTGDRGNSWGGHQVTHTVHNDGTERVIYIRGRRSWRLMKRNPSTKAWTQEAAGQTNGAAMIVRDPATDSVHVIAWPAEKATIYSAPSFAPVAIRPGEMIGQSTYDGVGIGTDGTLVVKSYYDYCVRLCTLNTDAVYTSGRWNGSTWTFNPVVRKNIGERYA